MKARRKEIVDVVRWYKVGDHPDVVDVPDSFKSYIPYINGATGVLIDEFFKYTYFVYPGDYIIDDGDVLRPDEFEKRYEIIKE